MGKIQSNLKFLCIIGILSVFISYIGCSNDDEDNKESQLIGVWTITDADIDATIGGLSIVDYFIDIVGLTQIEAEGIAALFQSMVAPNFTGTIEIKDDHTYVTTFGGQVDDGTWSLNSTGDKVTLDAGTVDEMVINIISVTSSTLVTEMETIESVDIDNNPATPDIDVSLSVRLTMTK
jgi:hypothetical protein